MPTVLSPRDLPAAPPKNKEFPAKLSYRMPAEWEPHEATWLTWPTNQTTWPGKLLKQVEEIYLQMMTAILAREKVNLLVPSSEKALAVARRLEKRKARTANLIFHPVKTVDTWIRDYGPIFIRRRKTKDGRRDTAFVKWRFNGWGGKYADLARDHRVVDKLRALKSVRRFDAGIVLEGGSIDVDGEGTCLTTEQCLLNPNRNPGLSRRDIERHLERYLGVKKVIWLKEGIEGDDTDGHIDDITRFVGPAAVVTAVEDDPKDPNGAVLEENLKILESARDAKGRKLKIFQLPMPACRTGRPGRVGTDPVQGRLPASYANFYVANGTVLVPLYGHANDRAALRVIQKAFPDRRVLGIECTALVYGLGSIHCVTQQEPKRQ